MRYFPVYYDCAGLEKYSLTQRLTTSMLAEYLVYAQNSDFDGIPTTSIPKLGIQCSRNSVLSQTSWIVPNNLLDGSVQN